jgi:hypothetical protein
MLSNKSHKKKYAKNITSNPSNYWKRLKWILLSLLLLFLLRLLRWLFSYFNIGRKIDTLISNTLVDPTHHAIINEKKKNELSGNNDMNIIPIAS